MNKETEEIKGYDSKIPFGIGVVNRKIYREHIETLLFLLESKDKEIERLKKELNNCLLGILLAE